MTASTSSLGYEGSTEGDHFAFFLFYILSVVLSLVFHKLNYPFDDECEKKEKKQDCPKTALQEKLKSIQKVLANECKNKKCSPTPTCSICLSDFGRWEKGIYLPGCYHRYHEECLIRWMNEKSSCPYCRSDISMNMQHIDIDEKPSFWSKYL